MARARSEVTLESVAQRAGVSLKTASNVVNGTGRMSEATRARVLGIVEDLGYKVNVAARNLTRGRTNAVSFAVSTLTPSYLGELAEAVIGSARERGYDVYVTTYPHDNAEGVRSFLRHYNAHHTDGLLLSLPEDASFTAEDFDVPFPFVCVGTRDTFGEVDRVTTDDCADARTATEYLFARGSTSIAVVGAHLPFDPGQIAGAREGNAEQRLRGIQEAVVSAGGRMDPRLIGVTGTDWTIGSGFRAACRIIDSGVFFDGLVCLNDGLAIGAISALQQRQVRVPEDVQVIGFDNIEESAYLSPPLTTMDSRIDWIARTSLDRLIARIDGDDDDPGVFLTVSRVIARETTR